jgi:ACR3 family arsenite transporter
MSSESAEMGVFERYLTLWVALCIGAGILIGSLFKGSIGVVSEWTIFNVNLPVSILVWLMIYPMMVQIDFSSLGRIRRNPKGIILTLIINWLVKPFTMAFFAWLFFRNIYAAFLSPEEADQYIAGAILLGAAPCTAMVFVWSYLTKGDPLYTLVQVSINDLIILVAFIPIVGWLIGVTGIDIPYETLFTSVVLFVGIPLLAGYISRQLLLKWRGKQWFEDHFMKRLKPISISALLLTLILLFAFQGERIVDNPLLILMIAIPLSIQTYFIFFAAWFSGRWLKLPHAVCSPASMIGASNFFELAVAVAIALFGLNSGAALATVVGVLIEVPIMLSLVRLANRWRY